MMINVKWDTVAANVTTSVYLNTSSFIKGQPCIPRPRSGSTTERRSQNVSMTVEMSKPIDKKKTTLGKDSKTQKDLFGT